MRDGYERFFEALKVAPDAFFQFGIDEIIHIPLHAAQKEWGELKLRMQSGASVAIRGFGRNGSNTTHFLSLYSDLFGHPNIFVDANNNAEPTRLLQRLTGYSKTSHAKCERLSNYQVSHVFGRTKNPYAFTAPWNVVYIPKIIDPFTGHEAPGNLSTQFQIRLKNHVRAIYQPLIDEFNEIVTDARITAQIDAFIRRFEAPKKSIESFTSAVHEAFAPIAAEKA